MAIEVFNRYEYKYPIDKKTYEAVLAVLNTRMEVDAHNVGGQAYTISNVYYDTPDHYLIRKSLSKPVYKEKLRLRSYGTSGEVFLEIKKKYRGIVNKRRTNLTLEEAYAFMESGTIFDVKEHMNKQVVSELEYFLSIYNLEPKVYIAYDRIAYFERGNPDLRISFDTNIRTRRYDLGLEYGDYGEPLMDEEIYIMEIKTSLAQPLWLVQMLTELGIRRKSFSKYGTEFKKTCGKVLKEERI